MKTSSFALALAILSYTAATFAAGPAKPARPAKAPTLKVGDPAPALLADRWLKGEAVEKFAPGKVYVVEFWASWCLPCLAAMPHLSDMQEKYKDQGVVVIAVDAREPEPKAKRGEATAKRFDRLMAFRIAAEKVEDDKGLMAETWLDAAGVPGMPSTWIIDQKGVIAWIGHPGNVERVLAGVVRGDYDPVADRRLNSKLRVLGQTAAEAVEKADFDAAWKSFDQMDALDQFSRVDRDLSKVAILLNKKKDYPAASALIRQLADGPLKNDWSMQSKLAQEIVALPETNKRDLELAVRLMKRVVELKNSEDWMTMKSFAAIYAAQGKWDQAIEQQTKVVKSLGGTAHDREKEILEGYRAGADKKK